jgi:hypothetical protein
MEVVAVQEFAAIAAMRDAARKSIGEGAITDAYGADRIRVVELLNSVLTTAATSRGLIESLLEVEAQHAEDPSSVLADL